MEIWVSLFILIALEIVLGIDNVVLLSVIAEKLPMSLQRKARVWGLGMALVMRVILLFFAVHLEKLTTPLFTLWQHSFSGRDLILLGGGVFLLTKATTEIFHFVEEKPTTHQGAKSAKFMPVLLQIIAFDLIFSLDSVLTAVSLSDNFLVMSSAVVISMVVMLIFAKNIIDFVHANPGIKMLALSFLVLISVLLIADGFSAHLERGYVYFAMAFSLGIELLNRYRRRKQMRL